MCEFIPVMLSLEISALFMPNQRHLTNSLSVFAEGSFGWKTTNAEPETHLFIILSLIWKYDIQEVYITSPIRVSKRKSVGGNILGRWTVVETFAHALDISSLRYVTSTHFTHCKTFSCYETFPSGHQALLKVNTHNQIDITSNSKWLIIAFHENRQRAIGDLIPTYVAFFGGI